MKKSVELLIIISISIIAVIILNLLLSLDPNPEPNVGLRIFAYVIMSIWMFSVPASYVYFYRWWNKKPFQEGTLIGNLLGIGMILVPIIIAPFLMLKYFLSMFKSSSI
ncbi:MAG TPA: hypothetical protein PLR16_05755 [Bacilli bacterium]|nr:MAG: hypothetical protein BWY97_00980 [Tenericutes bacterium ADurb.BinA124]HNZ50731.1 hypothetical protein [Bacilli bacterium]HPX84758.1 hypothetical protein [Bacilli bacterium]